jgi:hypothetical protein
MVRLFRRVLVSCLVGLRRFPVVEEERAADIVGEAELSLTGVTAREPWTDSLGNVAEADLLLDVALTGWTARFRLFDCVTWELLLQGRVTLGKTRRGVGESAGRSMILWAEDTVEAFDDAMPLCGYVWAVNDDTVVMRFGVDGGIERGMTFLGYTGIQDFVGGREAHVTVEVERVSPTISVARILDGDSELEEGMLLVRRSPRRWAPSSDVRIDVPFGRDRIIR